MAAKTVVELVRSLYPESKPGTAAKTSSGAVEVAAKTATPEPGEANYLPILILGLGLVAILGAVLTQGPQLLGNGDDLQGAEPNQNQQGQWQVRGWDGQPYG